MLQITNTENGSDGGQATCTTDTFDLTVVEFVHPHSTITLGGRVYSVAQPRSSIAALDTREKCLQSLLGAPFDFF